MLSGAAETQLHRRFPAALAMGAAFFGVMGIPALLDPRPSPALVGTACTAAVGFAALTFGIFSSRVSSPDGRRHGQIISFLVAGSMLLASVVGFVAWRNTFRSLYVASTGGALEVRLDGKPIANVAGIASDHDIAFVKVEVAANAKHRVTIVDDRGVTFEYDLDEVDAKRGWVIAPRAAEQGLCITQLTAYYGTAPVAEGGDRLLTSGRRGDFVPIDVRFDDDFAASPAFAKPSESSRKAIRAFACKGLRGEPTPWRAHGVSVARAGT